MTAVTVPGPPSGARLDPTRTASRVLALADLLEEAGLTGRGGAAFATATKLRSAVQSGADLIVNACDGELGAAKDAWVVEHHLDEARYGAELVAGRRTRWAAHRGSRTLKTLRDNGVGVLEVPHRYVSSEESALVSLASGGLARPLTKRTPVSLGSVDARGRRLAPTLELNAETVLRVAQIATAGAAWFRSFGTPEEPGPRLVHLTGDVVRPGILETAAGASVAELLGAAGGPTASLVGLEVSGLSGGWLGPDAVDGAIWSRKGLAPFGFGPGAGVLRAVAEPACPLVSASTAVSFAAGESAGQCGPCMFGLPAVAADLALLAAGEARPDDLVRLRGRLGLLPGRGACRFPDGVAGYAASALRTFAAEVDAHLQGGCTHNGPSR